MKRQPILPMDSQQREELVRCFLATPRGRRVMLEQICPLIQREMDKYYRQTMTAAEFNAYKEHFEFEQLEMS